MRLNPACPGVLFALVCLVALLRSQLVVSFHISATDWVGFEEAVPCPDYDLLMQLFNATNGPSWLRNSGWGTRGPCCDGSWDGVAQCDQSNHVLFLNLNANGMTGSIPESMPSFPQLNTLWMNLNQISGPFPSLLLSNPLLTNIDLSWNHMEGVIPWQSFSRGMQYFDVSGNQLSGTIPDDLFSQKMPLLVSFGLSSTQISGPIPSSLPTAPFLEDFTVENTLLSGTIPIATLTDHSAPYRRLETLYARSNRLSGTIPALLLNRPNLKYLYLSHNSLTGSIPSAKNATVQYLELGENHLSGTLPEFLPCTLGLNVTSNMITGAIPQLYLATLIDLWLADNQMTNIPNVSWPSQWISPEECAFQENPWQCAIPSWAKYCGAVCT